MQLIQYQHVFWHLCVVGAYVTPADASQQNILIKF